MADQTENIEPRVAALEARVARLEATMVPLPAAAPATTHVVYHYGMPPCAAVHPGLQAVYMPPCACGFSSHSAEPSGPAAPTPADFSKLGE